MKIIEVFDPVENVFRLKFILGADDADLDDNLSMPLEEALSGKKKTARAFTKIRKMLK